jgi:hypothetical protein
MFAGILTVTSVCVTLPLALIPAFNNMGWGLANDHHNQRIVAIVTLVLITVMNIFGVRLVALVNNTGVFFEILGMVGDGQQHGEEEHDADQERPDDGADHGPRCLAARVAGLLGEHRRGVEAVDDVERHEHRDQERPRGEAGAARVEDDCARLVVVEEREDEREDDLSYLIGNLALFAARLRGWPKAKAPFSLGRWGLLVNVLALAWGGGMLINFAWPAPRRTRLRTRPAGR